MYILSRPYIENLFLSLPGTYRTKIKMVDTFIFCRRVLLILKWSVYIFFVIEVVFLVSFPTDTERFSFWSFSWFFIKVLKVVAIGSRFFLGISESDFGDGSFFTFTKSAWFGWASGWYLRLDDISVVKFVVFESWIFGEGVLMWSVPPGGCGLVPAGGDFLKWDVCILKEGGLVGVDFVKEVGGMGLVAAHVLGGYHASVFVLARKCTRLALHMVKTNKINIIYFLYLWMFCLYRIFFIRITDLTQSLQFII